MQKIPKHVTPIAFLCSDTKVLTLVLNLENPDSSVLVMFRAKFILKFKQFLIKKNQYFVESDQIKFNDWFQTKAKRNVNYELRSI